MIQEQWKPIPGFEGYEASDQGQIRSYYASGSSDKSDNMSHVLKPSQNKRNGYLGINLHKGNYIRIANLVLLAFVGPKPEGMEICHRDGNPENNKLANLRYDTREGNMQDRKHKYYKTITEIRRKHHRGVSFSKLAQEYEMCERRIKSICYGTLYPDAPGPQVIPYKLTDEDVREIRRKRAAGESLTTIGESFNVSTSMVSLISSGKRRANAGGPITVGRTSSN